jgi:hypothetical protein
MRRPSRRRVKYLCRQQRLAALHDRRIHHRRGDGERLANLRVGGPQGIAISGGDLFVTNGHGNTVPEYTTAGALVDAALISGLADPVSIAPSGSDLFVVNQAGSVGEYTTAGATVNAALRCFVFDCWARSILAPAQARRSAPRRRMSRGFFYSRS